MVILGIDPGTATIGYAFVRVSRGKAPEALDFGVITTDKGLPMPERLRVIHEDFTALVAARRPDVVVLEELFFFRNLNTALPVAQARGVILLGCAQARLPVASYTPPQVKVAVTGSGRAAKPEVQDAVQALYELAERPRPDDAADALAIAWAHWTTVEGTGGAGRDSALPVGLDGRGVGGAGDEAALYQLAPLTGGADDDLKELWA